MYVLKRKFPTLAALGVLVLVVVLSSLSGCAAPQKAVADDDGPLRVVATTTMLCDLAEEIGGEAISVQGLMGPGVDPHLYQASAGDVALLQNADVVVYHGLHLEGKMGEVFASLRGQGKAVICIEDGIDTALLLANEANPTAYDPHIWFDTALWKLAAQHVATGLSAAAPEHAEVFAACLEGYLEELDALDAYIRSRVAELPPQGRILVTAHDAFRYFGSAYGFTVRGLQGISTDAEAGAADVSALADYIAQHAIAAIFTESSVPTRNIEALQAAVQARGCAVCLGGALYSDSLGDAASGCEGYVLTCRANVDTIVNALK